ncbi:galactokinase [Bacillus sp. TS-2]|nr:galactokinase [Bacillus sp. TS-2]
MENQYMEKFLSIFEGEQQGVHTFFAPGRVNLIGEHTDYNGGFVFPAALTIGTYMVIRLREDGYFHLASANFEQRISFHQSDLTFKKEDDWGNYPKGILSQFEALDFALTGADIYYIGHIPNGSGLSSSASIGMVTAFAFNELLKGSLSRVELAKLCQRMENHFMGVNSGIMDQFAVGLGKEDHALFINTHNLEFEAVPLTLGNYKIVITNTNKRRGLADSKYNERRSQCEEGLKQLQEGGIQIENLGALGQDEFEKHQSLIKDPLILARVRHVITEDERVLKAVAALKSGDLLQFGQLMCESHNSLRDDYEVTGVELDTLYTIQKAQSGCIGTRMTGAGFGGCTVSLVEDSQVESFCQNVEAAYEKEIGYKPTFYLSEAGEGVKLI